MHTLSCGSFLFADFFNLFALDGSDFIEYSGRARADIHRVFGFCDRFEVKVAQRGTDKVDVTHQRALFVHVCAHTGEGPSRSVDI